MGQEVQISHNIADIFQQILLKLEMLGLLPTEWGAWLWDWVPDSCHMPDC